MTKQLHSKRYRAAAAAVDRAKSMGIAEAIAALRKGTAAKFDETVEVHLALGIDTKKSDQTVRAFAQLPHGTGKKTRVAVFAEEAGQKAAKDAGATLVGGDALIDEIASTQKCDFDIAIAEPMMMRKLAKVAKILGQKGLMPNPKSGTVTPNPSAVVKDVLGGKIMFRNDDGGSLHQIVGKLSWDDTKLSENISALCKAVKAAKPEEVKGVFIKKAVLTTTMGPGMPLDTAKI